MIVDCHSHFIQPEYFGGPLCREWEEAGYHPYPKMTYEEFDKALKPVDRALVFGVTANALGVKTPHEAIADVVSRKPEKYIGFMALDPTDPRAIEEMDYCVADLGLKGIKLYPTMALFDVTEECFHPFFRRARYHGLPILLHFGASPFPQARMKYSQPLLLDEVAAAFPDLKMIIAHMGHPWQKDTIIILRKHKNVFADVSGLWHRPWEGYNALVSSMEWSITDKLLFGSDYPIWTPSEAIAGLRAINEKVSGTGLPQVSEELIESIINREALELLGLD
ncbi:MAG TPA: amidohydrolase family protein [Blastocatellia bacterium]|nr:amidohydrolase family protein [Blastocatellia bacterium]